jgi:hypothetical protein
MPDREEMPGTEVAKEAGLLDLIDKVDAVTWEINGILFGDAATPKDTAVPGSKIMFAKERLKEIRSRLIDIRDNLRNL